MIKILHNLIKELPIDNFDNIIYFKTKELFIDCDDKIGTDIDGEKGPEFPLHIKCEEDSISLLGIE